MFGHVAQPVAEHLGVGGAGGLGFGQAVFAGVEGGYAVVGQGVVFGGGVAFAFFGDDVQEPGALDVLEVFQGLDEHVHVVAVDGADVVEAELLEQGAGHDHAFHVFFCTSCQFPDAGHFAEDFFAFLADGGVQPAGQDLGEVVVHGADVGRDGHVVVVEDDEQVGVYCPGVVHGFEGHTAGDAAVADDGDHVFVLAFELGGDGHAQCGADGGAGVADTEGVVFAFGTRGEGAHAILGADAGHPVFAPGQYLVRVGLVPDIPDQLVFGGVEDVVQGDGQFNGAQARREMAARHAHRLRQVFPQFLRQCLQLRLFELFDARRIGDLIQQGK